MGYHLFTQAYGPPLAQGVEQERRKGPRERFEIDGVIESGQKKRFVLTPQQRANLKIVVETRRKEKQEEDKKEESKNGRPRVKIR